MADARHELGWAAEQAVAAWLEASGWRVVARRYRTRSGGEVDLIGLDPGDVLVGIEVRARRSARAGDGSESIDTRRTARIGRSVVDYASSTHIRHRGTRVDLVLVAPTEPGSDRWSVRRIPDIGAG